SLHFAVSFSHRKRPPFDLVSVNHFNRGSLPTSTTYRDIIIGFSIRLAINTFSNSQSRIPFAPIALALMSVILFIDFFKLPFGKYSTIREVFYYLVPILGMSGTYSLQFKKINPLIFLGKYSYGIYLWHWVAMMLFMSLVKLPIAVSILACIVLSISLSILMEILINKFLSRI
ncbi:MAG: acyltransferase family protein, partial [Actinomycetota bacterium]|nr:acyltransferase family protein [Actinomycetota bacterium]